MIISIFVKATYQHLQSCELSFQEEDLTLIIKFDIEVRMIKLSRFWRVLVSHISPLTLGLFISTVTCSLSLGICHTGDG